jgi:3-hydroxyisobutyrate dehydrogenase
VIERQDAPPRVGFIGLGDQGGPIAIRIAAQLPVTVWARRPDATRAVADAGATVADDRASLGAAVELLGVCVTDDDGLRSVLLGDDGALAAMASGSSIAVHSTVRPATVRELAHVAAARGISVVDAPVSGGHAAAASGNLTVLLGGDPGVIDRWRPVFNTFASTCEVVGGIGAGQLAKLCNNALFAINLAASVAALDTIERLGLDRTTVGGVLGASSGDSFALRVVPAMHAEGAERAARLLAKDVGILAEVVSAEGIDDGGLVSSALDALTRLTERADARGME